MLSTAKNAMRGSPLGIIFALFCASIVSAQSPSLISEPIDSLRLEYAGGALWGDIQGFLIDGIHAYCAMRPGIQIYDLSDPTNPVLVSQLHVQDGCASLDKAGSILYVGTENSGLLAIDLSNLRSPEIIGSCKVGGWNGVVRICDSLAWVGCGGVLHLIDISQPRNPMPVGSFVLDSAPWIWIKDIVIQDDQAFIAALDLWIVDISDPLNPQILSRFPLPVEADAADIEISDTILYLVCQSVYDPPFNAQFVAMNIADFSNPQMINTYELPIDAINLYLDGQHAYVGARLTGLIIFDISDPLSLVPIGCYSTPYYYIQEIAMIGRNQLVAVQDAHFPQYDGVPRYDGCGGQIPYNEHFSLREKLIVLDVTDESAPQLIGSVPDFGIPFRVAISGNYAYAYDFSVGITSLDITSHDSIEKLAWLDLPDNIFGLYSSNISASGDSLYVTMAENGLAVIDITDPANPVPVYTYDSPGFAINAARYQDYLLLADWGTGTEILDLSVPGEPQVVGRLGTVREAWDVEVAGNYAYTTSRGNLSIFDISDIIHPAQVASLDISASLITIGDGFAATGGNYRYFHVVDLNNDYSYILDSLRSTSDDIFDMEAHDNLLFIAGSEGKLEIFDLSEPSNPVFLGQFEISSFATDISVSDSLMVVAAKSSILRFKYSMQAPPVLPDDYYLNQNYPNPFNSSTVISFHVMQESTVNLSIYNILGQRVSTIIDEHLPPGFYSTFWNGTCQDGQEAASGIYLYRLKTGNICTCKKMLLLK